VSDPVVSVEWIQANALFEIAKFTFSTPQFEMMRIVDDGDPCRIVPAILELSEAVDDQRHDLFVPNVSDNSTHKQITNF
jgi:hypothetical protein